MALVKYTLTLEETYLASTAKAPCLQRMVVPKARETKIKKNLHIGLARSWGAAEKSDVPGEHPGAVVEDG